ncbi:MAG: serine/threonine protein kinase, partial [Planctomycetota bacterium]|nr:serine/threonine protein kinase [Planctomycetota bacterium]
MSQAGTTPSTLPTINGYQLLRKLGQGGMGTVFMARQLSMDRIVAVKILPPQFARNQAFVERFMREARLAGRLNHENVVNAIDAGSENGTYYLAMEYVEGSTVRDLIQKRGSLPEAEALELLRQAATGLKCAHENGLIHRDVKPDNLLLDKDGTVKLADLGLARSNKDDSSLTQTGTALGTPSYIAPEQARGDKDIDHRADLYALGAMLYHMLTGHTPFKGETAAVIMAKHLMEEPVHPRERNPNAKIGDGACQLVAWMMRKDANERPASAQEVIEAIARVTAGQPAVAGQPARGARTRRTGQHAPVGSSPSHRRGTEGPLKVVGPRMRDEGGYATRVGAPARQNN